MAAIAAGNYAPEEGFCGGGAGGHADYCEGEAGKKNICGSFICFHHRQSFFRKMIL